MNFRIIYFTAALYLSFDVNGEHKFTSIGLCSSNDTTAIEIIKCEHTENELFFGFVSKKTIRKLMVRFELILNVFQFSFLIAFSSQSLTQQIDFEIAMKAGKILRRVFKAPRIEWCSLMDGSSKNPIRFFKAFLESMNETSPEIFLKCPFIGTYEFNNLTLAKKFLMVVPSGSYVFSINMTTNKCKMSFKGKMIFKG